MTDAERASFLINSAARHLVKLVGEQPCEQPASWLVSGCHWEGAIGEIDTAISKLTKAKEHLSNLVKP